jgi:hypothetical protein
VNSRVTPRRTGASRSSRLDDGYHTMKSSAAEVCQIACRPGLGLAGFDWRYDGCVVGEFEIRLASGSVTRLTPAR